jgi:hypothetical protein
MPESKETIIQLWRPDISPGLLPITVQKFPQFFEEYLKYFAVF